MATARAGALEMWRIMHGRYNDRDFATLHKIPLPHIMPPRPAGRESEWPPSDAMKEWLNKVLDNEMHHDLRIERDRRLIRAEIAIGAGAANREATKREILAIVCATGEEPSDDVLLALLHDPAHTLSMGFRAELGELISRLRRRPANRPPRSKDERRGDSRTWRAYLDSQRLRQLLREHYPSAPLRKRKHEGEANVSAVADEIAAARWAVDVGALENYARRSKSDPHRLDK